MRWTGSSANSSTDAIYKIGNARQRDIGFLDRNVDTVAHQNMAENDLSFGENSWVTLYISMRRTSE